MSISSVPLRIAQISDFHCGEPTFQDWLMQSTVERINRMRPDIITDAGDLLAVLTELDLDVVLSGHKHVPFFWGLNGMLICNSGTATTRRLRGLTPPSWNEIQIDASTIKVYLHYEDGRRELSVIRSRTTRALIREAFYLTDDFLASNRIDALEGAAGG